MNRKHTFTVSKDIITTHGDTDISKYVRKAIKYFLDFKSPLDLNDYKLLFSPELELLCHPAPHCQVSIRLSDDDIKNIKKISECYEKTLSDTIDNMLKLYKVIKIKRYSDDDVRKLNKRICLNSSQPNCPKITGNIIARKTEKIKLRLPNGNGTQTITSETLCKSIEYAPDNIYLPANEIKPLIQKFNDKYKSSDSEIIEARITKQQMSELNGLKRQISSLLGTKDKLSDVLKYCVMYYEENFLSNNNRKPVSFTVAGNKTDKCFDTMFQNALNICDDKTIIIEVCAGSCGVLPMYYKNNVKAYILNELDDERRNLITKIKSDPYDLIDGCKQIYNLVNNSTYIRSTSKKSVIESIKTFLKLNKCMPEAITLFEYCIASQRTLSISKYLNRFKEKYGNVNKLRNYIYNSVVTGYDLFDLIEYFKDNPNVIFIIDPPYYLTDKCYSSNYPNMSFHKKLAELLHKIKGKFILCFRINASRANNSKNNRLIDRVLYEFYKASYDNEKFYMYCDDFNNDKLMINFKNSGTLEAVISNYKFTGCEPISIVLNRYKYLYNI